MSKCKNILLALAILTVSIYCFAKEREGEAQQVDDVQIKGEAKDKVKIKKFLPEIKIYIPDIVDSVTDKTEGLLQQGKESPSEEEYKELNYQTSSQTAKPFIPDIPQAPLVSFYPDMADVPVRNWQLVINDDKGNIVNIIKGKGNPVQEICWDGRNSRNQMLKVDALYSYKFVVYDNLKNPHTTFGKVFKVDAVIYKEKKHTIMEVSNKHLFAEEASGFNPDSKLVLEKILDVLRVNSKYPFNIYMYVKDPLNELVKERREKLVDYVAKEMLLMPEDVKYRIDRIDQGKRGDITKFIIQR
ncbi:MAG: hypothetical protein ABII27_00895 [bacterium]